MTPRADIEPIKEDGRGDQTHPAFGVAGVVRRDGTPRALFQSDLMHSSTVVLTIQTATRKRDLNRDWVHPRMELVEIEMSETQWGALVSSMGKGSGVPVTIRRLENDPFVPDLPYEPRTAENRREVGEVVQKLLESVSAAMAAVDAVEANKGGTKARREALDDLRRAISYAPGSAQFAVDSLTEAAESLVNQAQADIETQLLRAAAAHGLVPPVAYPRLELEETAVPVIEAAEPESGH